MEGEPSRLAGGIDPGFFRCGAGPSRGLCTHLWAETLQRAHHRPLTKHTHAPDLSPRAYIGLKRGWEMSPEPG